MKIPNYTSITLILGVTLSISCSMFKGDKKLYQNVIQATPKKLQVFEDGGEKTILNNFATEKTIWNRKD